MCQSYPIQCQLSITQVEELGYDKEEAVEVVRREVRCWLIININNEQVNAERAEGPRKAATRLWRAPRHGCHATWSWHPFKVNTHVVNADDDGEDLQADLHRRLRSAWESGRSQLQPGRSIQNHWRQVMLYKIANIRWCCWYWCAPGATTWGIPTGALQTLGCDDTWRQSIKTHKIFPLVSQTICHVWCCSLFRGIHNCWSTDI